MLLEPIIFNHFIYNLIKIDKIKNGLYLFNKLVQIKDYDCNELIIYNKNIPIYTNFKNIYEKNISTLKLFILPYLNNLMLTDI